MRVAALFDRINHVQLLYFWTAVREGGVARAAESLHLSKATISGQIKKLEQSLGHKLWQQRGKRMQVTTAGSVVFDYAERMFTLGEEMLGVLDGSTDSQQRLHIGIANGVPQLVAYRFIHFMTEKQVVELHCQQDNIDDLLPQLATNKLHLILSDAPITPNRETTTYNHQIDESPVALFGVPKLISRYRNGLPESLNGAPLLLPAAGSEMRRQMRRWLDDRGLEMHTVGEFANTALLKIFGSEGLGLFPAPINVADHVEQAFGCEPCLELEGCRERCFAITREAKPTHPLVVKLLRRWSLSS